MKNADPVFPESVRLSVGQSIRLNAWAFVAVVIAGLARLILSSSALPDGARAALALAPLLPGLWYLRDLWRWMRGLDELQRRIQFEAVCFGALGMLGVALMADLWRGAGFQTGLNFGWEGYFAGTFFLYVWGLARANRELR
jgi:hypothetical protein